MDSPGAQFFAGSCLTKNQYGSIAAGNLLNFIEYILKPVTLTDYLLMVASQFNFFLQISSFPFQLFF